jgi:hypothetical protein
MICIKTENVYLALNLVFYKRHNNSSHRRSTHRVPMSTDRKGTLAVAQHHSSSHSPLPPPNGIRRVLSMATSRG